MPKKNDSESAAEKTGTFAETAPDNIPQVEEQVGQSGSHAPDLEDFGGLYIRKSDGEKYALAINETDWMGRTHKATNTVHYWEGTQAQFLANFTTEDGKQITEPKSSKKKSGK